jgi:bile acid:Na+ symporter, BASS family
VNAIEERTKLILHFTHRYFIWMIILSYIAAAVMPGFGFWVRNVSFGGAGIVPNTLVASLPVLMLAGLLFNAGLGVKTEELTRLLQKPFLLFGALFCNVITPLAFLVAVSV